MKINQFTAINAPPAASSKTRRRSRSTGQMANHWRRSETTNTRKRTDQRIRWHKTMTGRDVRDGVEIEWNKTPRRVGRESVEQTVARLAALPRVVRVRL